jgi:hypothetical protein
VKDIRDNKGLRIPSALAPGRVSGNGGLILLERPREARKRMTPSSSNMSIAVGGSGGEKSR